VCAAAAGGAPLSHARRQGDAALHVCPCLMRLGSPPLPLQVPSHVRCPPQETKLCDALSAPPPPHPTPPPSPLTTGGTVPLSAPSLVW
jgi:hypothetical protein